MAVPRRGGRPLPHLRRHPYPSDERAGNQMGSIVALAIQRDKINGL